MILSDVLTLSEIEYISKFVSVKTKYNDDAYDKLIEDLENAMMSFAIDDEIKGEGLRIEKVIDKLSEI